MTENLPDCFGAGSFGSDMTADAARLAWWRWFLLWGLFFAIAVGLGYPILNRYDPRTTPGIADVFSYGQIIKEGPGLSGRNSYRVLQPMVGKPVYLLIKDGLGPWEPVCVALLASAAVFLATTLLLVMVLGAKIVRRPAVWLLAALLYVCNFWVPNGMLAGLVDASEACLLMLLVWTLAERRWWLLPLVGVLGGLAKETFVPLSAALAGVWWLVLVSQERRANWRALASIFAMSLSALAMPTLVRLTVDAQLVWPWNLAIQQKSPSPLAANFRRLVLDQGFYYPWVWLAPLAVWNWWRLPRPWLAGAVAAAGTAFSLGLWHDAGGTNVGRAMFNALGAPMSLAATMTLLDLLAVETKKSTSTEA